MCRFVATIWFFLEGEVEEFVHSVVKIMRLVTMMSFMLIFLDCKLLMNLCCTSMQNERRMLKLSCRPGVCN
jgi:hypothetical protein